MLEEGEGSSCCGNLVSRRKCWVTLSCRSMRNVAGWGWQTCKTWRCVLAGQEEELLIMCVQGAASRQACHLQTSEDAEEIGGSLCCCETARNRRNTNELMLTGRHRSSCSDDLTPAEVISSCLPCCQRCRELYAPPLPFLSRRVPDSLSRKGRCSVRPCVMYAARRDDLNHSDQLGEERRHSSLAARVCP